MPPQKNQQQQQNNSKLTLAQLSASLGLSKALKDTDLESKSLRPPTGLPKINLNLTNPNKNAKKSEQNNQNSKVKTHHSPPASPTAQNKTKSRYQFDESDSDSLMSPNTPPGKPPKPTDDVEAMFDQVAKEMGKNPPVQNGFQNNTTNNNDSDTSFSSMSEADFNLDMNSLGKPQLESTLQSHSKSRKHSGSSKNKSKPVDTKCEATVKNYLKPHFQAKKITKEQYKAIMKRIIMRYMKKPQSFDKKNCEKLVAYFVSKYENHNKETGKKIRSSKSGSSKDKSKSRSLSKSKKGNSDKKRKSRSTSRNNKKSSRSSHQAGHLKIKTSTKEQKVNTRIGNKNDMYRK